MTAGQPDPAAIVRRLIRARAPRRAASDDLPDDLRLGAGGLELDSISLAELLIDCGEHLAIEPPVELLEHGPLTVGRLVAGARAARRREPS